MQVADRTFHEGLRDVETPGTDAPVGLSGTRRPSVSSRGARSAPREGHGGANSAKNSSRTDAQRSTGGRGLGGTGNLATTDPVSTSESPRSSARGGKERANARLSPEERRRAELRSKFDKTEAVRQRDRKTIAERVDFFKEQREDRFKRLLDEVTGRDNLAYTLALEIRQREAHQENRRRELHAAWDEKVFQPIAHQAHGHMNPPDRAVQQRLNGSKSVSFHLPNQIMRLVAREHEDPARKPVVDHARENAFHQAATAVLGHSRSLPDLRTRPPGGYGSGSSLVMPALSRPVLEPTSWGQVAIQGTLYGHFAQVAEHGPGFHRSRRGGKDMHLPDEADGVSAAGTRKHQDGSYHSKGVLHGETASRGETSELKSLLGTSSAAPAQDHYTYETGTRITDLEFPPGKRMFPAFH